MIINMKKVLVTGSGGLVGYRISEQLKNHYEIIAPSRDAFDVIDPMSVSDFIYRSKPDVIVHAAAFSDAQAAESERDNKKGMCWKINVEGTENIVNSARINGAFVILLSTGSVFSGTTGNPGPFREDDKVSPKKSLGWYAYTKLVAEQSGVDAIIRLSHVIGPKSYESPNKKPDYLKNILQLYKEGKLFPLFPDQKFPITFLNDISVAVERVGKNRLRGIFHIVSSDMASPLELAQYVIKKENLSKIYFQDFIRKTRLPLRYSQYHALNGVQTRKKLRMPERTWRDIVIRCSYV